MFVFCWFAFGVSKKIIFLWRGAVFINLYFSYSVEDRDVSKKYFVKCQVERIILLSWSSSTLLKRYLLGLFDTKKLLSVLKLTHFQVVLSHGLVLERFSSVPNCKGPCNNFEERCLF